MLVRRGQRRQELIRRLQATVRTISRRVIISQIPSTIRTINEDVHILETGLAGGRVEVSELVGGADDGCVCYSY